MPRATFDASSMSTIISVRHGKEAVKLALEKKTPQKSLNSPQLAVECHQRFQELKSHMIGTAGDILDILAWRLCNAACFFLFFFYFFLKQTGMSQTYFEMK